MAQKHDHRVLLVNENIGAASDLEDALCVDVGRVVLGKFLAPLPTARVKNSDDMGQNGSGANLIALLGANIALVKDVRGVDDGLRQDGVSVSVAHVGLFMVRDALDVCAHGDRKGGAVLEEEHFVDEGGAELVGRDLRVGVGA